MARTSTLRHEGDRLTDLINIGVLAKQFPLGVIKTVLQETGRSSKRLRDLPAHVMVYYVIAMALYRPEPIREVLRVLLEGLSAVLGTEIDLEPAGKSGISQARKRLGEKPVRRLYEQTVKPIATKETQGAFYRGWHVTAMDGSSMEVPDTPENQEAFGRPASPSGGKSAFPLIRIVGLVEVGTRVLFGGVLGSYGTGEVTLAREVVKHLRPGMLCLADRYFPGYPLWKQATETGADLVWRVRQVIRFPQVEPLPDGSFLSWFRPPQQAKGEPKQAAIAVRVIDYRVEGPERKEETIRIITSILDWEAAPAHELAELYHERWEFETALDELKTHLRGARTVLRSKTPELVRQECYGLLLAHFALRGLMHEAALSAGRDPDRISFVHTLRVVRRTLPRFAAISPSGLERPARQGALRNPSGGRRPAAVAAIEANGEAKAKQVRRKTANRQDQDRPASAGGGA